MKKVAIILPVAVLASSYFLWKQNNRMPPPEPMATESSVQSQNPEHRHQPQPRQEIIQLQGGLSTGKDMFIADSPSETQPLISEERDTIVWSNSEEAEKVLKAQGLIPADVNNEAYVELDREELLTVEIGEYLDLYIPQIGGSYTGEVDHIQVHENGDRTVEAYIPGAGSLYSAVITIGKDAVYGTLGTQADVYIMEGDGRYAWLAAKSDLVATHDKAHVDGVIPSGEVTSEDDGTFNIGN